MRVKLEEPRVWVLYLTLWHDEGSWSTVGVVSHTKPSVGDDFVCEYFELRTGDIESVPCTIDGVVEWDGEMKFMHYNHPDFFGYDDKPTPERCVVPNDKYRLLF